MNTRKDYLNGKCTHEEYYSELVTESDASSWLTDHLIEKCRKSNNKYFSDVTTLKEWDNVAKVFIKTSITYTAARCKRGESNTLATGVCTLKQAMRMLLNEPKNL